MRSLLALSCHIEVSKSHPIQLVNVVLLWLLLICFIIIYRYIIHLSELNVAFFSSSNLTHTILLFRMILVFLLALEDAKSLWRENGEYVNKLSYTKPWYASLHIFLNPHFPSSFFTWLRQCLAQPNNQCSVQPHIGHRLVFFSFDILY